MSIRNVRKLAAKTTKAVLGQGKVYRVVRSTVQFARPRAGESRLGSVRRTHRELRLSLLSRKEIGREEIRGLKKAIKSGVLFRGEMNEQFRREFAERYGVEHAVTSTSGTAAIHVAMAMLNPNPGDEIIVPPITDMGTIIPVIAQNAIPVFADLDPHRWTLSPESIERNISARTRAIIPVHIFGAPSDMDPILEIGQRHGIPVIEDCAQAHLAEYQGRLVGTMGDIGCFSLQQTKQMTTGEGGMTVTNHAPYAERGVLFVDKGWEREAMGNARQYTMLGMNYRMTELQAAVGLAQIRKIDSIAARRARNGQMLREILLKTEGVFPQYVHEDDKHTYYTFPFTVNPDAPFTANALVRVLSERRLPVGTHYIGKPIYLCSEPIVQKRFYGDSHFPFDYGDVRSDIRYEAGVCPVAEDVLNRLVIVGLTERYTEKDVRYVADEIQQAIRTLSRRASIPGRDSDAPARLKAGIIGCGAISRDHAAAYVAHPDIDLVAAADISLDAAKTVASEFGIPRCHTDVPTMLAQESLDIVSISTWPGLHAAMTIAAAEHGVKAVFCEKPLAINLDEASKMLQACEQHGTQLVVAHQFRFNPYLNKARQLIESEAIGHVELVRGRWDSSLLNRGTHVIDAMRYLLGNPETEWVLGQIDRRQDSFNRGHRVEEAAGAIIQFAGGVRGLLETGELADDEFALHVCGSEGQLTLTLNGLRMQHTRSKGWEEIRLPEVKEHGAAVAEIVAQLNGEVKAHRNNAQEALAALEILMAVFESSRLHGIVRPPLETGMSPLDQMAEAGVI